LPRQSKGAVEVLAEDREAALRLVPLSDVDQQRLNIYQDLLLRWQGMLNLVSGATVPHLWTVISPIPRSSGISRQTRCVGPISAAAAVSREWWSRFF
jgi:hypothetical protein